MEQPWVELADAVRAVRRQLSAARDESAGESVVFEVDQVEMEFTVDVRRDEKAQGGIRVYVLTLGTDSSRSAAQTHRLKVVLRPRLSDGGAVRISDRERGIAPRRRGSDG